MKTKELKANLLLVLTAAIWGFAFVAQKVSIGLIDPFFYNGVRFLLGAISLIPIILVLKCEFYEEKKYMIKSGLVAGTCLFIAASLQQIGMAMNTDAGIAGFITSLYMVIIPVIGIFLKHKINGYTWLGIFLALIGLYLLCVEESFSLQLGDLLVLIGAFFWAIHVLVIDHYVKKINSLHLSFMQFVVCGVLCIISSFVAGETVAIKPIVDSIIPILYGGIMSVGVAYTLQVVAQKDAKPSHAAIILSMESCFSAIGGAIILGETMKPQGYIGCLIIFGAILISQVKKQ